MPHYTACVWCSKLIYTAEPPKKGEESVCSNECATLERQFRSACSNANIGESNERDFGINTWELEKRKLHGHK